ncbi:16S rRNA (cytosine(1402)-N(4))-methyltransferase RsmH [Candidatus Uhrbacteria bacterium]|nr:16S rRNA (cytosine(1402)-N(4))-methyltransferase RsmH [Candidatus Uhrbacteria bacterium]
MILHKTVLLQEALHYLDVRANEHYIDATLGGGGHTESILGRNAPRGKVAAFELDEETIERTKERLRRFGDRLTILHDTFRHIAAASKIISPVSGILYDLGLSTDLIKSSKRGFSFLQDEPLDMRFGIGKRETAAQIVNTLPEQKLADLIYRYGEERYSKRIARAIVLRRQKEKFATTGDLVSVIERSVPPPYRRGKIHCATRTFQALRIAVNDELGTLEKSLADAVPLLKVGGVIVVISFHSLEDRIVKVFFRTLHQVGRAEILTKKPVTASAQEIDSNPNARSAKLRALKVLVPIL